MEAGDLQRPKTTPRRPSSYVPPAEIVTTSLHALVDPVRPLGPQKRLNFVGSGEEAQDIRLYCAGDLGLVNKRCVAIVGTRKVTPEGARRAQKLARELVAEGIVIVSGLAEGVDTFALSAAIEAGGKTIAVIGTPLEQAYPAANKRLQETIYRDHLLVSQFPRGSRVFQSNFPQRNRVMAAISDATVIIEASDTSGTLHQAAECRRLNRFLFITKSLAENPSVSWPKDFLRYERTRVLTSTADILKMFDESAPCPSKSSA